MGNRPSRFWLFAALMLVGSCAGAQTHTYSLEELLNLPMARLLQLEFTPSSGQQGDNASMRYAKEGGLRVVFDDLNEKTLVPGKPLFLSGRGRSVTRLPGSTTDRQATYYSLSFSRRSA